MNEHVRTLHPNDVGITEKFKIPVQPKAIEHRLIGRREDINLNSTLGPFTLAPEYITVLPQPVIQAVGDLVAENSEAFSHFVPRNKERDSLAYQHCVVPGGLITESFFQVDMVALESTFLSDANSLAADQLKETIRRGIFEFEPSIAMYELIQTFGGAGTLKGHFRNDLDQLRHRHGKPIAILAPTQEKFAAVLATEFGLDVDHNLSADELGEIVKDASGFDTVMGPDDFTRHLVENNGECKFLLYVRPSDPLAKIKDPSVSVIEPILGNDEMRKVIKRNAITLNIDNPHWAVNDPRRIKDSKVALPLLGMGESIRSLHDVDRIQQTADSLLRAKPRGGVFGAYGQKIIEKNNENHRTWLADQIGKRGSYIIQPEMAPLMIVDQDSQQIFLAMDRNFFSMVSGRPEFMGGVRILIPVDSTNAKGGRLHGSDDMVTATIIAK